MSRGGAQHRLRCKKADKGWSRVGLTTPKRFGASRSYSAPKSRAVDTQWAVAEAFSRQPAASLTRSPEYRYLRAVIVTIIDSLSARQRGIGWSRTNDHPVNSRALRAAELRSQNAGALPHRQRSQA